MIIHFIALCIDQWKVDRRLYLSFNFRGYFTNGDLSEANFHPHSVNKQSNTDLAITQLSDDFNLYLNIDF